MQEMKYEFTQGQIVVESPIEIQHIEKLDVFGKVGSHGTIKLQVLLSESEGKRCINSVNYEDEILIYGLNNNEKTLIFSGFIAEVEVENNGSVYFATIKGLSWTGLLDFEKKSRSFQDKSISYDALFMKVLSDYAGSSFVSAVAETSQATGKFLLQYQETDWEFCQRVASILGAYLVPDTLERLPRFYVGLSKREKNITAVESSVSKKDYDSYQKAFSLGALLPEEFFVKYFVCCKERLELGDKVTYKNKMMIVEEKHITIENGVVRYRYVLAREEALFVMRKFIEQIKGVSLIGEVLDSSNQKIKMKLSIDSEQSMDAACWFPYASQADNLFYCMPEKGTTVSLYFSDSDETGAIAMNAVRKNGGSCSKTSNPSMKYMATPEGKELKLGIDDLDFSAHEQLFMKIKDDGGVTVNSNLDLNIFTQHKLALEAKEMIKVFAATGDIIVGVKDLSSLYLLGGPDGDAHIKASSNLIYDGRKKEVFTERLNKEIAYEEKKFEWGKLFTNVLIGLAAVAAVAVTIATFGAAGPVIAGAVISGCLAVGAMAVSDIVKGEVSSAKDYFFAGLKGAIEGAVSGAFLGAEWLRGASLLTHMFVSGGTSFLTDAISQTIDIVFLGKEGYDWKQGLLAFGIGFAMPAVAAGLKKGIDYVLKKCGKMMPQSLKNIFCVLCGEPVDAISGNMIYDTVDFEFPGPIPFEWRRIWISANRMEGHLGAGTRYNYEMGLEVLEEEQVLILYLNDGRAAAFPMLLIGEEYFDYANAILLRRSEEGYEVFDPDTRYCYYLCPSQNGYFEYKLVKVCDDLGHVINFAYDKCGFLSQIIDSVGRKIFVETNSKGRIVQISLFENGNKQVLVSYTYNGEQDLITIKDALNQEASLSYRNHFMVKKTDRNGNSFYWEYDKYEDGARTIRSWGDKGELSIWIDYHDNEMFNEVRISEKGIPTRYYYNDKRLCTRTVHPDLTETRTNYNEYYQIVSTIDEEGRLTSYQYNDMSQVTEIIQADSSKILLSYDDQHRLIEVKNPEGNSRSWEYNEDGTLGKMIDEAGVPLTYEYNENKLVEKIINCKNDEIRFLYDEQLNLKEMISPNGKRLICQYDGRGNCVSTSNVNGENNKYIYDRLNRIVQAKTADGNIISLTYDAYDSVISVKDKITKIDYTYTSLGNVLSRIEGNKKKEYKYDSEERLVAIINENGEEYSYIRDVKGNVISEIGYDGIKIDYERDYSGFVTKIKRPNNKYTEYSYDKLGRVIRADYSDKSFEEYTYNKNGELIGAKNQNSEILMERDCRGNIIRENQNGYWLSRKFDVFGSKIEVASSFGARILSQRNQMGQITHIVAQCNNLVPWTSQISYNEMGAETVRKVSGGIVSSFDYDGMGRVINHKVCNQIETKDYISTSYEWGSSSRLKRRRNNINKKNIIYRYNEFGNLVSSIDEKITVIREFDKSGNMYGTFDRSDRIYDKGNRLVKAGIDLNEKLNHFQGGQGKLVTKGTEFFYDEEGNMSQKKDKHGNVWQFTYYGNGLLNKVDLPSGKSVYYKYDALGRRIEKTILSNDSSKVIRIHKYEWDEDVILHEWDDEVCDTIPIKKMVDYKAEYVLRMESQKLKGNGVEKTVPNNLVTWVFEDDYKPKAKITNEGSYSICSDYLGIPIQAYDENGKIVWEREVDINGRILLDSNMPTNGDNEQEVIEDFVPFRFPGQYEDPETGLYYNRCRYYDPEIGQYTQKDPLGLAGGNPTLYGYVWDSLTEIDPLGLFNIVDFFGHPDLFPSPNSIVKITLTGSRDSDFTAAFAKANISRSAAKGYTWHHCFDFDPITGESTMQLIKTETHIANLPHNGSVSQFEKAFGVEYETYEAKMLSYEKGWRKKMPRKRCP